MYDRYNWPLWRRLYREQLNQKPDGNEPYVFHKKNRLTGEEEIQLFVDGEIYNTYPVFKQQADLALAGHLIKEHPMYEGKYIKRPDAEPIAERPLFILEDRGTFVIPWINATVKDAVTYGIAVQCAKDAIAEYNRIKAKHGSGIARTQLQGVEWTSYNSAENEPDDLQQFVNKMLST